MAVLRYVRWVLSTGELVEEGEQGELLCSQPRSRDLRKRCGPFTVLVKPGILRWLVHDHDGSSTPSTTDRVRSATHRGCLSCSKRRNVDEPGTLSPLHLPSEGTGVALQGARCFPPCSDGRNHSETLAGCIVSCTTASNCSRNWSRSTSWRKVALKAATVLVASYLRR